MDPGSSAFLTSESGINISNHISESVKILKFCDILCQFSVADPDPGSGMEKSSSEILD